MSECPICGEDDTNFMDPEYTPWCSPGCKRADYGAATDLYWPSDV